MFTTPDFDCITWRGITVPRWPAQYSWVYLLHFSEKLHHAGHYMGSTVALDYRLHAHRTGNGARLMEVITEKHIEWELVRLWRCDSPEEARLLEKKLKSFHGHSPALCPRCQHKPLDPLTALRQGHWPLALHSQVGRRRPSPRYQNLPMRGGETV